jgi:hypothetical protein
VGSDDLLTTGLICPVIVVEHEKRTLKGAATMNKSTYLDLVVAGFSLRESVFQQPDMI